jgi:polyisoprenoid-binding protein YceI
LHPVEAEEARGGVVKKKSKVLIGIGAGVVLLGGAGLAFGPGLYANYAASVVDAAPSLDRVDPGAQTAVDLDNLSGTWSVVDGSYAGYRVDEVLQGNDITVTGRTEEVTGSLTADGLTLTQATVTVDVGSIATTEPPRDIYFRDVALEVAEFPEATFTLTEPVTAEEPVAGEPQTFEATGELTLHGVTQQVTAEMEAVLTADGGQVSGSIPITFEDYGVEAPSLGFVEVEDEGFVEFLLNVEQD